MSTTALNRPAALSTMARSTAPAPTAIVRSSRLRITARGRAVLTTIVVAPLVAIALAFALNGGAATATSGSSTADFDYVTVEPGQSLWELAESIAPGADPRDVISDVMRLNSLSGSTVHPGERLAIPAAYSR